MTSYVFRDGYIDYDRLKLLTQKVGKEHIVLDLSCKKYEAGYRIVTDRWQKMTDTCVTPALLDELSGYCDEYLIHAVDVEGKCHGIETELVRQLAQYDGLPLDVYKRQVRMLKCVLHLDIPHLLNGSSPERPA